MPKYCLHIALTEKGTNFLIDNISLLHSLKKVLTKDIQSSRKLLAGDSIKIIYKNLAD